MFCLVEVIPITMWEYFKIKFEIKIILFYLIKGTHLTLSMRIKRNI